MVQAKMDVCIIYDTKRGATKQIANWMAEGLKAINGVKVDVARPPEVKSFDYDLFIIGSPIYWEKPMKSVVDFITAHGDDLKDKKVAIFVVCLAEVFGRHAKKYAENYYLKPLEDKVPGSPIKSAIFKGWLKTPDDKQRERCINWVKEIAEVAR